MYILARTATDSFKSHGVLMGIEIEPVDYIADIGRCSSGLALSSVGLPPKIKLKVAV